MRRGITLASWAAATIAAAGGMPDNISFAPDWRTIAVSLTLSVITLLVIGAMPAWKVARQELMAAIKDGGQQVSMSLDKARLRRVMMAAQVCGSCLILVLAAMMTRTLQRLLSSDLGFKYQQAAVLEAGLHRYGFDSPGAIAFWNTVKARVEQHPDTAALALALAPPLGGRVRGNTYDDAPGLEVVSNSIEPGFFDVMEIPLVLGRTFQGGDDPKTTVIISRGLANAMYGSMDVLGRGFPRSKPGATIVGVAGDAHSIRVESAYTSELYRPLAAEEYVQAILIARSRGEAATLAPVYAKRPASIRASCRASDCCAFRSSAESPGTRIASGIAVEHRVADVGDRVPGNFRRGLVWRHVADQGVRHSPGSRRRRGDREPACGQEHHLARPDRHDVGCRRRRSDRHGAHQRADSAPGRRPRRLCRRAGLFVVAALTAALLPAIRVLKSDPIQSLRHS